MIMNISTAFGDVVLRGLDQFMAAVFVRQSRISNFVAKSNVAAQNEDAIHVTYALYQLRSNTLVSNIQSKQSNRLLDKLCARE